MQAELVDFLNSDCGLSLTESQRVSTLILSEFKPKKIGDLLKSLRLSPNVLQTLTGVSDFTASQIKFELKNRVQVNLCDLGAKSVNNLIHRSTHNHFNVKEDVNGQTLSLATSIDSLKLLCVDRSYKGFSQLHFESFLKQINVWNTRGICRSMIAPPDAPTVVKSELKVFMDLTGPEAVTIKVEKDFHTVNEAMSSVHLLDNEEDDEEEEPKRFGKRTKSPGVSVQKTNALLQFHDFKAKTSAPKVCVSASPISTTTTADTDSVSTTVSVQAKPPPVVIVTLQGLRKKRKASMKSALEVAVTRDDDCHSMRSEHSTQSKQSKTSTHSKASFTSAASKQSTGGGTKRKRETKEGAIKLACANLSTTLQIAWSTKEDECLRTSAVVEVSAKVRSPQNDTGCISEFLVQNDFMSLVSEALMDPFSGMEFVRELLSLTCNVSASKTSAECREQMMKKGLLNVIKEFKRHPALCSELLHAMKNLYCGLPVVSVSRLESLLPLWIDVFTSNGVEINKANKASCVDHTAVQIVCETLHQVTMNALSDLRPNILGPIVTALINAGIASHLIRLATHSTASIVQPTISTLNTMINGCESHQLATLVRVHQVPLMFMLVKRLRKSPAASCIVEITAVLAVIVGCDIVGQVHVACLLDAGIFPLLVTRFDDKSCKEARDNIYSTCVYAVGMAGEQQVLQLIQEGVFHQVLCHPDKSSDMCSLIPALCDAFITCQGSRENSAALWRAIDEEIGWQMLKNLSKSKDAKVRRAAQDQDWIKLLKLRYD